MNIDDAVGKTPSQTGFNFEHIAGQADQVDGSLLKSFGDFCAHHRAGSEFFRFKEENFDFRVSSSIDGVSLTLVRDQGDDVAPNLAGLAGVDERLKVASLPGGEHRDSSLYFR